MVPSDQFKQCPHCQLPHEVGLSECPITGHPLDGLDTVRPPPRDDSGIIGRLVSDKYEVVEELGRGSMGRVYRAMHAKIGREVALKILRSELAKSDRVRNRFVREAQATGRVDHQNVVQIWDVGVADGLPYMVMELLRGEPLTRRLERERRLPIADALTITRQVLSGLAAAHAADVVHRDIKPDNIVVDRDLRVKLVDFGVARILEGDRLSVTQSGDLVGTPGYLAPEQAEGSKVDAKCDAWAATVVLYEMVVGELPFGGQSVVEQVIASTSARPELPSEVRSYLPKGLDGIIEAGLRKAPEDRASVDMLLALVQRLARELSGDVLADTADEQPPESDVERTIRNPDLMDTIVDREDGA